MIFISLSEPWCTAVCRLLDDPTGELGFGKAIENRPWVPRNNDGSAFRGRVALHASSKMTNTMYGATKAWCTMAKVICPRREDITDLGVIRGTVEIVDVIEPNTLEAIALDQVTRHGYHPRALNWWMRAKKGYVLKDFRAVRQPIPMLGALGPQQLDPSIEHIISALGGMP